MATIANRLPGPGVLWHTNAFGKVHPGRLKPEFVQHGSTNIEFPLGSERALSDGEDRQHFDCATWLHKAREMSKGKVKREVEKELTGRETEAWETNHASVGPLRIGAPPFAPRSEEHTSEL